MYELHRLLGALFSQELTKEEKLDLIHEEYDIQIDENLRKDVSVMCNLSQGIKEAGIEEGKAEGKAEGRIEGKIEGKAEVVINMYNNGFTMEQIMLATEKSKEEVQMILAAKLEE